MQADIELCFIVCLSGGPGSESGPKLAYASFFMPSSDDSLSPKSLVGTFGQRFEKLEARQVPLSNLSTSHFCA